MAGEEQGQELEVLDRTTGELVQIRTAPTDRLAAFLANEEELRAQLAAARAIVESEVIARMDRELTWTVRVGDPAERQVELKSQSPQAGTVAYDEKKLYRALRPLVSDGTISEETLARAVKRRVTIQAEGWDTADLEQAAAKLGATPAVNVSVPIPEVNKLAKLKDERVDAAIAAAKVETTSTRTGRKVSVNVLTKKAARRR